MAHVRKHNTRVDSFLHNINSTVNRKWVLFQRIQNQTTLCIFKHIVNPYHIIVHNYVYYVRNVEIMVFA